MGGKGLLDVPINFCLYQNGICTLSEFFAWHIPVIPHALHHILKDRGLGRRVMACLRLLLIILLPCSTTCGMLQDGEASRLYQRQHSKEQQPLMQEQETLEPDLLPCDLADSDSLFNAVGAVEVHHKISYPEVSISPEWITAACHNIHTWFLSSGTGLPYSR